MSKAPPPLLDKFEKLLVTMCRVIRIFVFCESGTSVSAAHKAKMAAEPAPGGLAIGRVVCGGLRKK